MSVTYIHFVREHGVRGKYYFGPRVKSRKHVAESRPWDGANLPRAPIGHRGAPTGRLLSDRERVREQQAQNSNFKQPR